MTQAEVTTETQTGTADIAAAVTAERFAPQPRDPHRAQVIAAIHAYAEWLAQRPDVPVPDKLLGARYGDSPDGAEQSIADVRHMISDYGAAPNSSADCGWAVTWVMQRPLQVEHTVFCGRPGQPKAANRDTDWLL